LNGKDLTGRSLAERRIVLKRIVHNDDPVIRLSHSLEGSSSDIVNALREAHLEGIIAKRKDSLYQSGERSGDWIKLKLEQQQEFVIGGYRPDATGVDALLVGFYEGKQLMFAGKVPAGFVPHVRREVAALLQPLHSERRHFSNLPDGRLSRWDAGITAEQMKEMQ
jgi:bifunctional non-homologous end joining protein LigD